MTSLKTRADIFVRVLCHQRLYSYSRNIMKHEIKLNNHFYVEVVWIRSPIYFSFCYQSSRGMEMDALSSTFYPLCFSFCYQSSRGMEMVALSSTFYPLYFNFCYQSSRGMEMDALSSTFYLFISVSATRVHVVWRWMPFHPHSISWCEVQDSELQNLFTGTVTSDLLIYFQLYSKSVVPKFV